MKYKDIPQFSHCPFCQNPLSRGSLSEKQAKKIYWKLNGPKIIIKCESYNRSCNNVFVHLFEPGNGNIVHSMIIPAKINLLLSINYPNEITTLYKVSPKSLEYRTFTIHYPQITELNLVPSINFDDKDNIIKKLRTMATFA